jgi:uracil-DNA glycosylase
MAIEHKLRAIHRRLKECRACPNVCDRAVYGPVVVTPIMIVGQAPGVHEGLLGRPFAYTAGKTLFKWLESATGADEETVRAKIYFTAVARCFPGKTKSGRGDRLPDDIEIENCRRHLRDEVVALKPKVILAVGRLAISQVLGEERFPKSASLADVVGKKWKVKFHGVEVDVIALPHPSGASSWPHVEPGKTLLRSALRLVREAVKDELS